MRRVYFLLQRVIDGLPNTANTFQAYLTETGTKIVQEQKKKQLKDALANAVAFVKALMVFYEKYYNLVNTCFSSHPLFKTALDKVSNCWHFPFFPWKLFKCCNIYIWQAFRDVMNQESGTFNIPRLLNFYIDSIIKGKEKELGTEDETDVTRFRANCALLIFLFRKFCNVW
jgi:hypothetical protein